MTSLIICPSGHVTCVYAEDIDLSAIGSLHIRRASHVEPDETGRWWADLSPVDGPMFGPHERRSEALAAEVAWLEANVVASNARACAGGMKQSWKEKNDASYQREAY